MKKIIGMLIITLTALAAQSFAQSRPGSVKIYLVALNDNGKNGRKIGCDDSIIAVTRQINSAGTPLKSAIAELLAIPREYNQKLGNYWGNNNLEIKSIVISKGIATIRLSGDGLSVAGICDEPRIISQIEATAKQFPAVKKVRVFVNGISLAEVIN